MVDIAHPLSYVDLPQDWLKQVQIGRLQAEDLTALEWEGAYTHYRRVYAQAFQRAQAGNAVLWVAKYGELMLGQLFVLLDSLADPELADGRRRAFIHSFRVRPGFRRGGLGSRLLGQAEVHLRRRGFTKVSLNVARVNLRGQRFYERHGYQRVGADDGRWSYKDHLGRTRRVHEPGWRLAKQLINSD